MTAPLFLTPTELRELTGFAFKARQIEQLRQMGLPFCVNGCGKPVVARAAIDGSSLREQQPLQQTWHPAVLQGGR